VQAEDGIRDRLVTGVQTCALPIYPAHESLRVALGLSRVAASVDFTGEGRTDDPFGHGTHVASLAAGAGQPSGGAYTGVAPRAKRSEERRVGKESRDQKARDGAKNT